MSADPGGSFGDAEPPGATVDWQIGDAGDISIGPLQLSMDNASGLPPVTYPPFTLVQDMCSGQTLTGANTAKSYCPIAIALDPRLPAGGTYAATLMVRGGNEMLSAQLSATIRNP